MTLDIPFRELKNYPSVILTIHGSGRPARPPEKDYKERGLTDEMWSLMQRCWAHSASDRPLASIAMTELDRLFVKGLKS